LIIRRTARTNGERALLWIFYAVTVLWILALLTPFAWMLSSACKNRLSVFRMPPQWIPDLPREASIVLDYEERSPSKAEVIRDAVVVTWMTWDQYGRESIWGVEMISMSGGRTIFECRAPSYKIKHQKERNVIAAVLDVEILSRYARELMAGIEHRFVLSEPVPPDRGEGAFVDQARSLKNFLAKQRLGAQVQSVRIRTSFWRLFDAFISAWLYMYETMGIKLTFGRFILNSLVVAGTTIVLQLFISSLAAYTLSRLLGPISSRYLLLFFLATIMIPPLLLFMPLYLMMKAFPMAHIPFTQIALPTISLLDPELPGYIHPMVAGVLYPLLSYLPLILPHTAWGFAILLFKGFFDQLPEDLIEAARLDGASEFRIFSKVVFPLSKPVFSVLALWTFLAMWQNFMWPYIVSIVQPQEFWTYPVALYYRQSAGAYANEMMALAVLASLPTIVIFLAFQRFIERGIVWTGLKG
jgi:multiple sugar transport system permease protein